MSRRAASWACAAAAAGAQVALLSAGPKGLRGMVPVSVAALTLAALAALAAWTLYGRRRPLPAVPSPRSPAEPGAEHDPSPEMFLATRLAQRGVGAQRIAEHCGIPRALADLLVEEARHQRAAEPGRPS